VFVFQSISEMKVKTCEYKRAMDLGQRHHQASNYTMTTLRPVPRPHITR
jgi:hypothetical protein